MKWNISLAKVDQNRETTPKDLTHHNTSQEVIQSLIMQISHLVREKGANK